ncbi:hypothetical protein [Paraglaciecola sp.]|uniref:hypothetical protein n=1 Tax=Paraglaciecola sp. TaxID=1920173 RepID=UPI003EF89127
MLKTNKNVLTTAIIGAIATTLMFTAQVDAKGFKNKGKRAGDPVSQLTRLDVNEDGVVDLTEFLTPVSSNAERSFTKKDTDENGALTFEEATASNRERTDISDIIDELAVCLADKGIEADLPDGTSKEERFEEVSNGDGTIELSELVAAKEAKATAAFEAIDTDESGDVTEAELTAANEARTASRQALKDCIDEVSEEEVI